MIKTDGKPTIAWADLPPKVVVKRRRTTKRDAEITPSQVMHDVDHKLIRRGRHALVERSA